MFFSGSGDCLCHGLRHRIPGGHEDGPEHCGRSGRENQRQGWWQIRYYDCKSPTMVTYHLYCTWLQILYIVASSLTLMHILLHGYIRVSLTWLHISLLYMVAYHLTCCISHYMVAYILPWLHISLYGCISHYRVAHHITWLHNSLYGCISPCMVACNLTWLQVILHGCTSHYRVAYHIR